MGLKYALNAINSQEKYAAGALPFIGRSSDNLIAMKIGTAINRIRKARGYTQVQLCDATEIDQGNMSRILNDKQEPTIARLEAIARALNMKVYEIVRLAEINQDPDARKAVLYRIIDDMSPSQVDMAIGASDPGSPLSEIDKQGNRKRK